MQGIVGYWLRLHFSNKWIDHLYSVNLANMSHVFASTELNQTMSASSFLCRSRPNESASYSNNRTLILMVYSALANYASISLHRCLSLSSFSWSLRQSHDYPNLKQSRISWSTNAYFSLWTFFSSYSVLVSSLMPRYTTLMNQSQIDGIVWVDSISLIHSSHSFFMSPKSAG